MKASPWVIAIVAIVVALVAGRFGQLAYRRAEKFEAQARLSLEHDHVRQVQIDLLTDEAAGLRRKLAAIHTTTARRIDAVVAVDLQHIPDTSCAPNLAARDSVIESQQGEISVLGSLAASQDSSINLLRASRDELRAALEARPKLYPRIVGPNVGLGVFVGVVGVRDNGQPAYGVGVGITVNVISVRF